jgi:hypothetical protein
MYTNKYFQERIILSTLILPPEKEIYSRHMETDMWRSLEKFAKIKTLERKSPGRN